MNEEITSAQRTVLKAGNDLVDARLRLRGTSYEKSIEKIMKELQSLNTRLCNKIRKERDKDKKMTIGYWNSLSKESQERALKYCFPIHPSVVEMLLNEKPSKVTDKGSWWWQVFDKVRIPLNNSPYKTKVNNTYLM